MIKKIFGILVALVIITSLVCASQMSGAYFTDTETAAGNSLTGWIPSLWTQTSQSDFSAGVSNHIDIDSSPGDVKLSKWYNVSWLYRKKIIIDHTQVGADLTNYPVLINLTDSDLANHAQSSGNDILFTASDAVTRLNHEIEMYTSVTGQLIAWVNVPGVSSTIDTILYLYYGNASADNQQSIATTWNGSFMAVWHMHEISGAAVNDSTVNANTGTPVNTTLNTSGIVDGGDGFNGTTAYTNLGSGTSLNFAANSAFSFEGWFKTSDSYGPLFSFRNSASGGADIDVCLGYDGAVTATAGSLLGLVRGDNGSAGYARITGPVVNNNAWHYFVLTRNTAGTIQLFCDGASIGTDSGTESTWAITTNLRALASERRWVQDNFTSADNTYLSAALDEFRVSNIQLPSGWITTVYNNLNSPGTFSSLSAEEPGATADLILFWNGTGAVPSGWTDISAAGQPFNNAFPLGATSYTGIPGGSTYTHTHTGTRVGSITSSSSNQAVRTSTSNARASATHTHDTPSPSVTVNSANNIPPYRDLRVIKYNNGVPSVIPAGAIAIFDTASLPAGWISISGAGGNYNAVYPRGAASVGTSAVDGSRHTVSVSLGNSSGTTNVATSGLGTTLNVAASIHTHTGSTQSGSYDPPYISVVLAQTSADTSLPVGANGLIGMFDATPSNNWSVLSGSNGIFNGRFIKGSSSYGNTGGSYIDAPANVTITTGGPSSMGTAKTGSAGSTSSATHTHAITYSFNSVTLTPPPYIEVVIAKAVTALGSGYVIPGTLASQVLDTGAGAMVWNAMAWDATLPAKTGITLEVRASDDFFTADDAVLPWTPIAGSSPALTGLPAGQYKQWRVTLATQDGMFTPVLTEVRLYYYGN
jgi:hypothetical protein